VEKRKGIERPRRGVGRAGTEKTRSPLGAPGSQPGWVYGEKEEKDGTRQIKKRNNSLVQKS